MRMHTLIAVAAAVVISAGITAGVMSLYMDAQPMQPPDPSAVGVGMDDGAAPPASDVAPPGVDTGGDVDGISDNNNNNGNAANSAADGLVAITSDVHLKKLLASAAPSIMHKNLPVFQSAMGEPAIMFDMQATDASGGMRESGTVSEQQAGSGYSGTNVQVLGVDEPDYVKNDGQYAYIAAGNVLTIVDVWPASEMHVAAKVALDIGFERIENMFLNGDDLMVLYTAQSNDVVIREYDYEPTRSHAPVTGVAIIDVTDRKSPEIRAAYSIDGWPSDARMIGDHVYVISTSYLDYDNPRLPVVEAMLPRAGGAAVDDDDAYAVRSTGDVTTANAFYFADETDFTSFTTISAIDLSGTSDAPVTSETFLMGSTSTYYVTHSNLYLTYAQYLPPGYDYETAARERFFEVIVPLLPEHIQSEIRGAWKDAVLPDGPRTTSAWSAISEILQDYYNDLDTRERDSLFGRIQEALASYDSDLARDHTKTIIHKVSIDDSTIAYEARGSVSGRLLNQFSLGESGSGERLRVATTTEYYTEHDGFVRSNGVYALDANLDLVGMLEGVAPDESIYSARFMGDRLYMVTFEQIDPFFVIDISGDTPVILGELKIPGFSTYLHPYDDDHVIGLGRDTKVEGDGGWVRQLGIKVALFGVADVSNPVVADEVIIGDSSAYSEALHDHKAFFFEPNRGMMSLPVVGQYGKLDSLRPEHASRPSAGMLAAVDDWAGFYIIDVDAKDGIDIRGAIPSLPYHDDAYRHLVPARTFHIDDVLYTVSGALLVASDIDSLERLGHVRLVGTGDLINYMN